MVLNLTPEELELDPEANFPRAPKSEASESFSTASVEFWWRARAARARDLKAGLGSPERVATGTARGLHEV